MKNGASNPGWGLYFLKSKIPLCVFRYQSIDILGNFVDIFKNPRIKQKPKSGYLFFVDHF